MQSLEIISVNLWQVLISLANLALLYAILKYFLYKPVRKMLADRQAALDAQYAAAQKAEDDAKANRAEYERKLRGARAEADALIQSATAGANRRSEQIVSDARERADGILRQAQTDIELERRKAADQVKREIASVSTALTEKVLGREINEKDHRAMIDAFLHEIGDDNG